MFVSIIFGLEFYHFMAHVLVLCGWRMLPRQDLVKQRIYFLVDLICASTSYYIHKKFLTLIIIQNIQHAFYFLTWERSWLAKRVVSWSSLDWDRGRWNQVDLVFGTLFDVLIHAMNCILLIEHCTSTEALIITIAIDVTLLAFILFNPKFAWATPSNIPSWVQKRLKPLSADERQEIKTIESLGDKLTSKFF